MIYLDYSATTPMDPRVMDVWLDMETNYFANANSTHYLGLASKHKLDQATISMASLLHVLPSELIFTSSATESNNLAIKGLAQKYPHLRHIITSPYEHASNIAAISYLQASGYEIDFVPVDSHGLYDLKELEKLIRKDTLVVSLIAVDSETGIRQDVEACGALCHQKGIFFHSDLTQALGKCSFDLTNIDLASFSAHKIYGPKGIGLLVKKETLGLIPLLHGGHSLSPYRSSTPQNALVVAFSKAYELASDELDERIVKVSSLNSYLRQELANIPRVVINSTSKSLPHILNISILDTKPEKGLEYFSSKGICLSSKSACSGQEDLSDSVLALTKDVARAKSSYRISLSHLSTKEECDGFISAVKDYV